MRFPVVDRDFDLLVWTTTPWTLVSNVGAAVGPDIEYVRVRTGDGARDLVLAEARVAEVVGDDAEIVGPLPRRRPRRAALRAPVRLPAARLRRSRQRVVVADEFVTIDDGSRHRAPRARVRRDRPRGRGARGPPDAQPGRARPRRSSTRRTAASSSRTPTPRSSTRSPPRDASCRVVDHTHSYPHCWRCSTPLIYWAKPEWFARTTAHKDALLRENEAIGWHPDHIKHGRFGDWLENNVDWALSRDRFWGTPLPIWRCDDCGTDTCVGSVAELAELAGRDLHRLDLHRPDVDDVVIDCPKCARRPTSRAAVEPVLDVWFDSGAMPAAQFHYPFENDELFERRFPADFICEAIDQTRGWFYSLLAVNTLVFDRTPYRNVVCLALLLNQRRPAHVEVARDRHRPVDDPRDARRRRAAVELLLVVVAVDAEAGVARAASTSRRAIPRDAVEDATRFFVTYANLDGWEPASRGAGAPSTHVVDRWVRSRLHATVDAVTDALEAFDALRGAQALERFVDDLSNWYVRRSRPRFWNAGGDADDDAHATLHEACSRSPCCSRRTARSSPTRSTPTSRGADESVHLADWPVADASARDAELEDEMARAARVVSLGLSARNEAKLKVRQPLRTAFVLVPGERVLRRVAPRSPTRST